MTLRWVCALRPGPKDPPAPTIHNTEAEAQAQADHHTRTGQQAVIYQADIEETDQ